MNHIKAQMTFSKSQKLTLTLTPTHRVRQWEIITQLWHTVFPGLLLFSELSLDLESFCLLRSRTAASSRGPSYQVRPSSYSWRWIWGSPQPFCTLPYSQVSGRNWKKPCPGIREIRAGHCLQPSHGPLHHERDPHFFKTLPQLLVFCFTSLPCPTLWHCRPQVWTLAPRSQQAERPGSFLHQASRAGTPGHLPGPALWGASASP